VRSRPNYRTECTCESQTANTTPERSWRPCAALGDVVGRIAVTSAEALEFVRTHGVVLEAAIGPVPSLASMIAGGPIRGSWWGHARSHDIFVLTRVVRDCPDVLVCRLVDGKITYVHRRLWPALVCLAKRFPRKHLAMVHEKHTVAGRHVNDEVAYPGWVSPELAAQAAELDEQGALRDIGSWCVNTGSVA